MTRAIACLLTFVLGATPRPTKGSEEVVIPPGPIAWYTGHEGGAIIFSGDRNCFCSCGIIEPCPATVLFLGGLHDLEPIPIPGCDSCLNAGIVVTRLQGIYLPEVGSKASLADQIAPMHFGWSSPSLRDCGLWGGYWGIRITAVPDRGVMEIRRTQEGGGYFDLRFPATFYYEWWQGIGIPDEYALFRYSGSMGTLMVTAQRIAWGQENVDRSGGPCPSEFPLFGVGRAVFTAKGTSENPSRCAYFLDGEVIFEGAPFCRSASSEPIQSQTWSTVKELFRF